jgi:hypothetical protein
MAKSGGHKFPKLPNRPAPPVRGGGIAKYMQSANPAKPPSGRKK